jgi:hypothetical protein
MRRERAASAIARGVPAAARVSDNGDDQAKGRHPEEEGEEQYEHGPDFLPDGFYTVPSVAACCQIDVEECMYSSRN